MLHLEESRGTILMPIGDAAEVLDTFYPLFRLERRYEVVVAGPQKRAYHLCFTNAGRVGHHAGAPGYTLAADVAFRT